MNFQDIILELNRYWAEQGCVIQQTEAHTTIGSSMVTGRAGQGEAERGPHERRGAGSGDDHRQHPGGEGAAQALRPRAGDDAAEVGWFDLCDPPPLAFDHADILAHARKALELTS